MSTSFSVSFYFQFDQSLGASKMTCLYLLYKVYSGTPLFYKLFKHKSSSIPVDILTGYAHWAGSYPARAHNPLMVIEEEAMLSLLPAPAGKVCLDLACGSGRYIHHLHARQAGQVFGLDYSAHMLAQAKAANPCLSLARSPFLALPFADQSFDLITCGMAVGHEKNLAQTLAEAARLLRPDGAIVYSDFHPFAVLAGWQRTFTTTNGQLFELEHHVHLYHHHQQACQAAGLLIEAVLEPLAGEYTPPQFRELPVVLAIRAIKIDRTKRGTKTHVN
jgi:malonyl-CoA O-methyltransferase